MNPTDVWNLRLLKGSDGHYLLGNPLQQGPVPTPWGARLVPSGRVAAGSALVGRFDSVHFLALDALSVLAFNQHKDYAQRNMVYVRAEQRGRQLFYAPREVVVAALTV
jgi:HK97 family phage major capsid protein